MNRHLRPAAGWDPLGGLSRAAHGIEDSALLLVVGVYVFVATLDVLTTANALTRGGRERNPVAANLYAHWGMGSLYAFKTVVMAAILAGLALLPRRAGVWVGTLFTAIGAAIVVANAHALTTLH